jgi:hypothetical protein
VGDGSWLVVEHGQSVTEIDQHLPFSAPPTFNSAFSSSIAVNVHRCISLPRSHFLINLLLYTPISKTVFAAALRSKT